MVASWLGGIFRQQPAAKTIEMWLRIWIWMTVPVWFSLIVYNRHFRNYSTAAFRGSLTLSRPLLPEHALVTITTLHLIIIV